jgi:hypothetical protein
MEEFRRIYLMSGGLLMVLTVLVPGIASAEAGIPFEGTPDSASRRVFIRLSVL